MIKYKTYNQSQELLLPPNLDEFIGEKDLVRVVDHLIDKIDQSIFDEIFKGGGCPSYNPVIMLKRRLFCRRNKV